MLDCLLIADDVTGACDAAVYFAKRGRRAVVGLELEAGAPCGDVAAVSTNSRSESRPLEADALRRLPFREARILFKKIDSTMRGNVGGEITAVAAAFECEAAVITPAFPAVGRVVEAGFLRLKQGQAFPPIEVARRLRWQGAEPCLHVKPDAVLGALESGVRFISVDALSDEDLDWIVKDDAGKRVLWAGSGGLAGALARTIAPQAGSAGAEVDTTGASLFCIGSDHPVTQAQLDRLIALRPDRRVMRIARGTPTGEVREAIQRAAPRALVLSGGDTALLVLRAVEAQHMEMRDEILSGIPHGILRGGLLDGVAVATKAGAFGGPDALIRVADFFQ